MYGSCPIHQIHNEFFSGTFQYGGPWIWICPKCYGSMKFGVLHYQYLFQVLCRTGLPKMEANIAIAKEMAHDGITAYPVDEERLAGMRIGSEGRDLRLEGPTRLVVSGALNLHHVPFEAPTEPPLNQGGSTLL